MVEMRSEETAMSSTQPGPFAPRAATRRRWLGMLSATAGAAALAACGAGATGGTTTSASPAGSGTTAGQAVDLRTLSGTVRVDGSSTVFPVSEAMAEEFQKATGGRVRVTVGISGTGGGFKKFCADETDVQDASRPILAAEMETCTGKEIRYIELPLAFDGLSIVVSPRNTWVDTLKVSELRKMWEPAAQGT